MFIFACVSLDKTWSTIEILYFKILENILEKNLNYVSNFNFKFTSYLSEGKRG